MKLIDWQYYPKWHLSFHKSVNEYIDEAWFEYWICIGPIQLRFRGKSWPTHLRRDKYWIKETKKLLLNDIKTQKFKKEVIEK